MADGQKSIEGGKNFRGGKNKTWAAQKVERKKCLSHI